jgi:hypothetical protein
LISSKTCISPFYLQLSSPSSTPHTTERGVLTTARPSLASSSRRRGSSGRRPAAHRASTSHFARRRPGARPGSHHASLRPAPLPPKIAAAPEPALDPIMSISNQPRYRPEIVPADPTHLPCARCERRACHLPQLHGLFLRAH